MRHLRWPTASLRAYLVLVIVVATVPLALFSFHLVSQQAERARQQTATAVVRSGDAFALLVEQELNSSIDLLTGLSYNDALLRGDPASFHRQLQRGMPVRASWRGVYLAEPSGRIVFTSDQPFGTDHGRLRDGLALERIRTTLRPTVTDLVRVAASGELVTGVQIPVILAGRLEYVLGARIAASHWQALAERTSVSPGGTLVLTDRGGRVVAHRLEPGRIGRVLPAEDAAAASPGSDFGVLAGMFSLPSFSHRRDIDAGGTGWTARADVPAATLADSQAIALLSVAAAGALSLLLGLVLAMATGRRVTQPLRQLARGETVSRPVVVREIAALESALRAAGEQSERAREALERAHRAAEQANRGKDEFLAMLGHELRNPLGAIGAAVEVLNRTGGQGDIATSARRVIERQTRHMAQLINDLQDVARASAGKLSLEARRIELSQLVWRAIEALRLAGRFRHHMLTVDVRPAWLDADATRLEQVVSNLLTNAAKYTPADGSITLSLRAHEGSVHLVVTDNGLGISPAMLPHVFDLFVQGERAVDRRQAGMGLGLALVRRLVELHGGTVEATSEGPQCGSEFTVRLPGEATEAQTPGPWHDRHAVIVAPAEQALLDTAGPLCAAGCRVTLAAESPAAIAVIRERLPDIVFVDLALPGASELAVEIRAASVSCAIVGLVAGSGDAPPEFDAIARRPLDPDALLLHAGGRPMRAFAA